MAITGGVSTSQEETGIQIVVSMSTQRRTLTPSALPSLRLGLQRRRWDDGGSAIQIVCDIKEFATGPSAIASGCPPTSRVPTTELSAVSSAQMV